MGDENVNTDIDNDNADNDENADNGQDDGGSDNDQDKNEDGDDADKGQDNDKSKKKEDSDDDKEPPVRKSPSDFYKARQARKAAKENQSTSKKNNDDEDNKDGDDDIAPEDEEIINKVVDKKLQPLIDQATTAADAQEAKDFFSESPEFKPFKAKIMKWWSHPTRRHLPLSTVALEAVGYKNLIKIGAQRHQDADDKAKKLNSGGGNSPKGTGGKKSFADMTDAEFQAERERVLANRQ
jgi:hypothetical protein